MEVSALLLEGGSARKEMRLEDVVFITSTRLLSTMFVAGNGIVLEVLKLVRMVCTCVLLNLYDICK